MRTLAVTLTLLLASTAWAKGDGLGLPQEPTPIVPRLIYLGAPPAELKLSDWQTLSDGLYAQVVQDTADAKRLGLTELEREAFYVSHEALALSDRTFFGGYTALAIYAAEGSPRIHEVLEGPIETRVPIRLLRAPSLGPVAQRTLLVVAIPRTQQRVRFEALANERAVDLTGTLRLRKAQARRRLEPEFGRFEDRVYDRAELVFTSDAGEELRLTNVNSFARLRVMRQLESEPRVRLAGVAVDGVVTATRLELLGTGLRYELGEFRGQVMPLEPGSRRVWLALPGSHRIPLQGNVVRVLRGLEAQSRLSGSPSLDFEGWVELEGELPTWAYAWKVAGLALVDLPGAQAGDRVWVSNYREASPFDPEPLALRVWVPDDPGSRWLADPFEKVALVPTPRQGEACEGFVKVLGGR